jgi:hypothetical protein
MKDADVGVIVSAERMLVVARDEIRSVRLDPDAALCEADTDNLLDAEQHITDALLALNAIEVD